jgi:hypothetical protein
MKQLIFFFSIAILLVACAGENGDGGAADSLHTTTTADSISNIQSGNITDAYIYSEVINKEGSVTRVTNPTTIFSDSLLQINTGIVLATGEYITIEKYSGTTAKNNWNEPVYRIAYKMGPDIVHGYTSQSYIASRVDTLKSNKLVTLTLGYNLIKDIFTGNVQLLNPQGGILGNAVIDLDIPKEDEAPHSFTYYLHYEELKQNTGLEGVTEAFYIGAGYDACGYPHINNILFWNDKKLLAAPPTYSVADADVFYESSYLIFPADSLGKKSCILNIIEAEEDVDNIEDKEGVPYKKKDSTVILFKWHAAAFSYSKGDTIIKTSRTFAFSNHE